jgi:CHC2-type zinc finger protein
LAGRSDWSAWIGEARQADPLVVAQTLGVTLKKAGVEWIGPCPACGGTDRFAINIRKRVFNCRGAEGGDTIAMVEHITGCAFIEAVEQITGSSRPDRSRDEKPDERSARLKRNAERNLANTRLAEDNRKAEEARARADEQAVHEVLERAVPIAGTHAEAYMRDGRGLTPSKRLTQDLRFVADLDYWGAGDNGSGKLVKLAVLPALVAIIRAFDGAIIGISQTYLDPKEPKKWSPVGSSHNSAKKIRGDKRGGMIRLGRMEETMAIAEGWENALAWHQLGHALNVENLGLGAAIDLGNLSGRSLGTVHHKWLKNREGKRITIANGKPDPSSPGIIIPDGVKSLILLGDSNSESLATTQMMRTAVNRFFDHGLEVSVHWAPWGRDWNEQLQLEGPD